MCSVWKRPYAWNNSHINIGMDLAAVLISKVNIFEIIRYSARRLDKTLPRR